MTPIDPATLPTGFFTVHNASADVPVHALVHATKHGTEITIQQVRLDPNVATSWHTHPGPGIVAIQKGALTYEDGPRQKCRRTTYETGSGFVDPGFGHVHRAVAGPGATHVTPADPPEPCIS